MENMPLDIKPASRPLATAPVPKGSRKKIVIEKAIGAD
jgi:hypothetical protein